MPLTEWKSWAERMRGLPDAAFVAAEIPGGRLPFPEFLQRAEALARRIPGQAYAASALFVADAEPVDVLLTTVAALTAGIMPILGSKAQQRRDRQVPAFTAAQLAALPDTPYSFASRSTPNRLAFASSGSTGDGEIVEKCWSQLAAELAYLERFTQLTPGSFVFSFVPPVHIYGFLYSFLLPIAAGADVHHASYADGVPRVSAAWLADADLALIVPSLWPLLSQAMAAGAAPSLILSSGAPWDAAREAEFVAVKAAHPGATRLFDVLGSTETGGIGRRELGVDPPATFTLFDAVEIDFTAMRLRSPFADPDAYWVAVADAFEPGPAPGTVVHRGRTDRVFKLGGKRFALGEIERALASIAGVDVRCRFRNDPAHAKGGELVAFVEAATLDYPALRRAYLDATSLPFPARVLLVPSFRPNALGKLSLAELEAQAVAILK